MSETGGSNFDLLKKKHTHTLMCAELMDLFKQCAAGDDDDGAEE